MVQNPIRFPGIVHISLDRFVSDLFRPCQNTLRNDVRETGKIRNSAGFCFVRFCRVFPAVYQLCRPQYGPGLFQSSVDRGDLFKVKAQIIPEFFCQRSFIFRRRSESQRAGKKAANGLLNDRFQDFQGGFQRRRIK